MLTDLLRTPVARRVAVTGAGGFIGSRLVEELAAAGHHVLAVDSGRTGSLERVRDIAVCDDSDITEMTAETWQERLAGVDTVFHLAAEKYNTPGSSARRVIATNVSATAELVRGAAEASVRKVVFTSSLYAYGSRGPRVMDEGDVPVPDTYYGMSKLAGEHILRAAARDAGLRWTVARLFFIYGPRQWSNGGYKSVIMSNFERMRDGEPPVINGDGAQALDYVYIDDAVDALIRMADPRADGSVLNVASGIPVEIRGLTAMMRSTVVTAGVAAREAQHGPADWTAGSRRFGATERTSDMLGWTATTGLETGLERVWSWLREDKA